MTTMHVERRVQIALVPPTPTAADGNYQWWPLALSKRGFFWVHTSNGCDPKIWKVRQHLLVTFPSPGYSVVADIIYAYTALLHASCIVASAERKS